jgi:hypothetical protein
MALKYTLPSALPPSDTHDGGIARLTPCLCNRRQEDSRNMLTENAQTLV